MLNDVFAVDFTLPPRAQLRAAVLSTPLSGIGGINKADILREFYGNWAGGRVKTVEALIYGGYYQGQTTQQIVNQIRGTKRMRYRDGQISAARRDMEMLTRTAVQHAATQARRELYDSNDDVVGGVQIVSTLDDRTTAVCRSMDGRVFSLDEERIPLPPYHVGCRTTTVPVLKPPFDKLRAGATRIAKGPDGSEIVPAKTTYYEWLKTQPKSFQDDAIGPTRAKLLRDGSLSAEKFARLSLGNDFEPLTLAEMRAKEPGLFDEAIGEGRLVARRDDALNLSSGRVGDEKDGTVILEKGEIDFNDSTAVMAEIERFAEKYARANVEYALAITTNGEKYIMKGGAIAIDPSVVGADTLKGSVGIHNHPLILGGESYDSFSVSDLKFAAWHEQGKQYLISGARRNAFEFTEKLTPAQVEDAWNKAYYDVLQKHKDAGTAIVWEQEERLRIIHKYLKGFVFYENF